MKCYTSPPSLIDTTNISYDIRSKSANYRQTVVERRKGATFGLDQKDVSKMRGLHCKLQWLEGLAWWRRLQVELGPDVVHESIQVVLPLR